MQQLCSKLYKKYFQTLWLSEGPERDRGLDRFRKHFPKSSGEKRRILISQLNIYCAHQQCYIRLEETEL